MGLNPVSALLCCFRKGTLPHLNYLCYGVQKIMLELPADLRNASEGSEAEGEKFPAEQNK
jgi:hypothetical protein